MPTTAETIYFNGIDGTSGAYGLAPQSASAIATLATHGVSPTNLADLRYRRASAATTHLGVREGIDPKNLAAAGWGVVFAHDADPAIAEALGELLAWRQAQAGERFRIFQGPAGVRAGERKSLFLARHGAMPGPVEPDAVPYYLLLVGDPAAIPFEFQYQLDVQYAVGRLHFATLDAYAAYAHSVVQAEQGGAAAVRRASFVGVSHPGDEATVLSATCLVEPLARTLQNRFPDWQVETVLHDAARKARLHEMLAQPHPPALWVTASHGLEFPLHDADQRAYQGALLCADWPGTAAWPRGQRLTPDYFLSASDLDATVNLNGSIALLFACYGAGTPQWDEYGVRPGTTRRTLAAQPFVASLPARMLSHPNGGALAVISHVARSSSYSFGWPGVGAQTTVFQSCLDRLLNGYPVGAAVEYFNERWAELAVMLQELHAALDANVQVAPEELARLWLANADARSYVVLGDPAVRLPVV